MTRPKMLVGAFIAYFLSYPSFAQGPTVTGPVNLTGIYDCPAYEAKDNSWNAHRMIIDQKELAGVMIIVTQTTGGDLSDKLGPYKFSVAVADNLWRFEPLYRHNKLYPLKTKTAIVDGRVRWEADYPAYTDNAGKKRKPHKGSGNMRLDTEGNLVSEATHFTGMYVCKKAPLN